MQPSEPGLDPLSPPPLRWEAALCFSRVYLFAEGNQKVQSGRVQRYSQGCFVEEADQLGGLLLKVPKTKGLVHANRSYLQNGEQLIQLAPRGDTYYTRRWMD